MGLCECMWGASGQLARDGPVPFVAREWSLMAKHAHLDVESIYTQGLGL